MIPFISQGRGVPCLAMPQVIGKQGRSSMSEDFVLVPCEATNGAFANENMISIETANGTILGFVRAEDVIKHDGKTCIQGIVHSKKKDTVTVRLTGSFPYYHRDCPLFTYTSA